MVNNRLGISERDRIAIAEGLNKLLADSYVLHYQLITYHWNIVGLRFLSLHTAFERQYKEIAVAIDEIGERVRALGVKTPPTLSEISSLSSINEKDKIPSSAEEMVEVLASSHEAVIVSARCLLVVAQESRDETTVSIVSDRLRAHEKFVWLLRATQEPEV